MKETRFKDTEIGRIPEEWEVKVLGKVCDTTSGGTPARSNPAYYEGNIPWITTSELKDGHIYDSKEHITISAIAASSAKLLPESTLLMAMYGATIGKLGITTLPLATNQACCAILPKEDNIKYLFYKLLADRANLISKGCGAGQPNISQTIIKELKYSFPGKVEQSRIAAALTSVDDLISALDKLIEKKKNIKQGSMQLLLTGKKRLKGFSDPWQEIKLGTGLKFISGAPFHSSYFNTEHLGLRLIKNRDLKSDDQVYYYNGSHSEDYLVKNGDLLVGMDGAFIPCLWKKGKALLNQRVGRIVTQAWDTRYLYYTLLAPLGEKQEGTGATTVKHLSHNDVENMQLFMSTNVDEQTAIASILTSMDDEISSLETKKAKYEQIKQGMMQQLLTGKIRLIEGPA